MKRKHLILAIALILLLAAALTGLYFAFREQSTPGSKSITITVVGKDGQSTLYSLQTQSEYLRQAMEEAEGLEFSGTESEFGLLVETVNGDTPDFSADGAYWGFYVNGEYCNYGIDTQPVHDGDAFQIVYCVD